MFQNTIACCIDVAKCLKPFPLKHVCLRLLQQTTFENIVAKEEMAPTGAISSFVTMFSKLSIMEFKFLSVVETFIQIFLTVVCCKTLYLVKG